MFKKSLVRSLFLLMLSLSLLTQSSKGQATVPVSAAAEENATLPELAAGRDFEKPQLIVQKGNSSPICALAVSPDGKYVLMGGWDRLAVLVDIATGREVRQFEGHTDSIGAVAFSPDGQQVVTASDDRSFLVWDIATGKVLRRFYPYAGKIRAVAFSSDGKQILTGSTDKTVRLWDATNGQELHRFEGHGGEVWSVAFSSDGKQILTGGADKTARLWDITTGQEIHRFEGHTDEVQSVAFSPDGKLAMSGSLDKTARLWDIATGQEVRRFEGHSAGVWSVAFTSDGRRMLSVSLDSTARLWNVATGREVRRFEGHTDKVLSLALTRDERQVLTGSADNTVRLWDIATGQENRRIEGHTDFSWIDAFSPDGRQMLIETGNIVRLWDIATGKEIRQFVVHTGNAFEKALSLSGRGVFTEKSGNLRAVVFSPDGKQILTGSRDNTVRLWDIATGKEVRRFEGHTKMVFAVAFSPDGKQILTAGRDTGAILWNVATGKEVRRFEGHTNAIHTVAFSPDARQVATASSDKTMRLWDIATGQEVRRFEGHTLNIWSVDFSPDGQQLLTASSDNTARLWDITTGKEVRRFEGHTARVFAATFSPDGQQILTGGGDGTACLWDRATGKLIHRLGEYSLPITSASFSPDGKKVLTGGANKTTRIWDTASGRNLCSLVSFDDGGWVVVDPAGRYDSTPNGTQGLHYVKGMTSIDFEQLKDGFYEPNLLSKACGFNLEPLRSVPELARLKLFPEVALKLAPQTNQMTIRLWDQGGGIGKVRLFINGREAAGDARLLSADGRGLTAESRNSDADGRGLTAESRDLNTDGRGLTAESRGEVYSLLVNLVGTSVLPGQKNEVKVVVYNSANDLSSRGAILTWQAPGTVDNSAPRFFAIVAGTSDYANPQKIKSLRFAAKDARDMAQALAIGARQLFQPENVTIRLLTGEANPVVTGGTEKQDFGRLPTSKANFAQVFASIAKEARPQDTVVVYLAGHGTVIGQGESDYRYLTQDAASTDLTHSPFLKDWTLSSQELADWMLNIKARKQVLILDTCSAGAASTLLLASRSISSDQKRAIERAKDRAGFYALMGSAPDAFSYESSRYNQGLLTYALLEGMRGRSLREDKYVDIATWFHYAEDRVPQLASNVSQRQKPEICAPHAESFDVGLMTAEQRREIPLAVALPQVLKPRLIDAGSEDAFDPLGLSAKLSDALRAMSEDSERGGGMVYVDVDDLPGALSVTGRYDVQAGQVTARLTLRRDGKPLAAPIVMAGKADDLPAFADQLAIALKNVVVKLPTPEQ